MNEQTLGDIQRREIKIFGSASAMTLSPCNTSGGEPSVSIDITNGKRRAYDWKHKVTFQLTARELIEAAAVFCGLQAECHFDFHGEDRNKSLRLKAVADGLVCHVAMGGEVKSIRLTKVDQFLSSYLLIEQISAGRGTLPEAMIVMLKQIWTPVEVLSKNAVI